MKISVIVWLLMVPVVSFAQEKFWLQINDTLIELEIDKEKEIASNGCLQNLKLLAQDTVVFEDAFFSFKYLRDINFSKAELDADIEQYALISAEGTGILIQKYSSINPVFLNELMLNEATRQDVQTGYNLQREDYSQTLASGRKVKVTRAVLTLNSDTSVYEVVSFGHGTKGILIVCLIPDTGLMGKGLEIIKLFWESLLIKIPE